MTDVHCYHVYNRESDSYEGHHDLCRACAESFIIEDETHSLHDSGDTNRSCEICEVE